MLRFLGAISTLALIVLSVLAAWTPIETGESMLRERLGSYEHVGWLGTGLRLLYTVVLTAIVLVAVLWPLKKLSDQIPNAPWKRWETLAQCLAVAMIHWFLFLPVWCWMGIGIVNALWDHAPSQAEQYRFLAIVHHSKGPDRVDYARVDDPDDTLSLYEIHPPYDTKPGTVITLHSHRGALGMPYMSSKPCFAR